MPVIGHLEGNCHVYVDRDADVNMAREIVLNAKLRRTGVCGAAETVLFDRGWRRRRVDRARAARRRLRSARR